MDKQYISNGIIEDEERPGWTLECTSCGKQVRYTVLNVIAGEDVFLYNEKNADFTLREEDLLLAQKIDETDEGKLVDELEKLYHDLEEHLPKTKSGGKFRVWSNIKCPHCNYEFPYNGGNRNKAIRFLDSKIIWVEGATAYRGKNLPSNRLVSVKLR